MTTPTPDRLTEALRAALGAHHRMLMTSARNCSWCWEHRAALAAHPEPGELDAAWAEAEAALPEGWWLHTLSAWSFDDMAYYVEAASAGSADYSGRSAKDKKYGTVHFYGGKRATAYGPTPAAALRALAATLREAR